MVFVFRPVDNSLNLQKLEHNYKKYKQNLLVSQKKGKEIFKKAYI